jgi:cytoskeletal protein CcmA (bactofilin family)
MANQPGGPPTPSPTTPLTPPQRTGAAPSNGRRPVVGPATAVRGQLAAREDLWIEGQFEGEIQAPAHQVTVSAGGRVRAEIRARSVVIEGDLHGNVIAEQMVLVRAGGSMQGDIRAPRVGLEEGCQFQGNVDMDGTKVRAAEASSGAEARASSGAEAPAMVGERNG